MLEIKLRDVDALHALLSEFNALTYLQGLVQYDANCNIFHEDSLKSANECAEAYLWDKQLEAVAKFTEILQREDFACKVHD